MQSIFKEKTKYTSSLTFSSNFVHFLYCILLFFPLFESHDDLWGLGLKLINVINKKEEERVK